MAEIVASYGPAIVAALLLVLSAWSQKWWWPT
jgi:hypothetical protein